MTFLKQSGTFALLVGALLVGMSGAANADDRAIAKARRFIENRERTVKVLFFLHPEAEYRDLEYKRRSSVTDDKGKTVAGHFALTYDYIWRSPLSGDTNRTKADFFFNSEGNAYWVNSTETTSDFKPGEGLDLFLGAIKRDLLKDPTVRNDKNLVKLLESANALTALSIWLITQNN